MTLEGNNTTEADSIALIAQAAAEPWPLEPGKLYAVANGDGGVRILSTDDYAERPRHRHPTDHTVADFPSFRAYLEKHGVAGETEISASKDVGTFSAVVNAGGRDEHGRADHVVRLQLRPSPEWKAWTAISNGLMDQERFAEFVEDHALEVADPDPTVLLEVAQSLQVARGVTFESAKRLSDGNVQFGYREDTTATAGSAGQLSIPATLTLALAPFVGHPAYKVEAAFRYRLQGQRLTLGVKLLNADKVRDAAFAEVAEEVEAHAAEAGYLHLNT
jgi:uncharacterized protein YfdQ (DUF2303 family)